MTEERIIKSHHTKRIGGYRIKPWGAEPQRDLDAVVHWRADVMRTMERLSDLYDGLSGIEQEMRAERPYSDMFDGCYVITRQAEAKLLQLKKALGLRIFRQLEKVSSLTENGASS